MQRIGDRIKEARRRAGLNQPALAKACGWASQGRVSNYERNLREPKTSDVRLIAKALGVSEAWLWTGSNEGASSTTSEKMDSDAIVEIGFLDDAGALDKLVFTNAWFSERSLSRASVYAYCAAGNSMSPTINDGEILVIDTSSTTPSPNKVFVLRSPSGELMLRRFLQSMTGDYIVSCDNTDKAKFPDERISANDISSIQIVGRVVWRGGEV